MKEERLSDKLTFEEFAALAGRQPNLHGRWIYRYEAVRMDNNMQLPYPKFEIWPSDRTLFLTFEDAEAHMRKLVDNEKDLGYFYCHNITQLPVGDRESEHGARWLYDADGNLIDYSIAGWCGKPEDSHFFGHPAERLRFKKGDIVEVCDGNSVRLMIIVSDGPTIEDCWGIYQRCIEFAKDDNDSFSYILDPSDEQWVVVDGPGYEYHEHVSPLYMIKPRFPVPDDMRREMLSWLEIIEKPEPEKPRTQVSDPYTGKRIGEFYALSVYLHYDKDCEIPHLHFNDGYSPGGALRIDRAEYYDHDCFIDWLDNVQMAALDDYFKEVELGKTRWWHMLHDWNENHSDEPELQIPLDTPMPDYGMMDSKVFK